MKSVLIVLAAAITVSGCGMMDRTEATLTGYSDHCIDGVMYYQFRNGATVAYNKNGTIKTCGK